jgi:hypothetical protein
MIGEEADLQATLDGYCAVVDLPGAAVWQQLADEFPEAPVLLSTRSSAEVWWESANATILEATRKAVEDDKAGPQRDMILAMWAERFTPDWDDQAACMAAYDAHNQAVRDTIPADRLFEYQPGDAWGPLRAALDLPEPSDPFPHTNTTAEFRSLAGFNS